ncbi:hypothetical protein BLNAU_9637 [Blattamonas nauphoetae]|uniref:Uncharacterized protein n=1 Tax=Blattamonas nauphoetae TaxID=2049346 RepID=A0ABQ9XV95_9EUKA|nr:hypothetical protein BLNAU_9637 [Blattamonas nauphoetae]
MSLATNGSGDSSMTSKESVVNGGLLPSAVNSPPRWNLSNISGLLEVLQCDDENSIVDTLRELQKMASGCCSCMESLFFEPEIVDPIFLQHKDFIFSTFDKIGTSSPPPAVVTTFARISLFQHLGIASTSLQHLFSFVGQNPLALTLLPSPIFPSSSPYQQYSGFSFLSALIKKLQIVLSDFQPNIPTDPSHISKYAHFTKDDTDIVVYPLDFCVYSSFLPILLLNASPPIEVDSEIIQELILMMKDTITSVLTNISDFDNLIASFSSDSSPTTPLVSEVHQQAIDSLKELRTQCEVFMNMGWRFFNVFSTNRIDPYKSSFQTIVLDDPSFSDIILNSIKLHFQDVRRTTFVTITNIIINSPSMREQFITGNLVGKMFETIDFVSLPLSESNSFVSLTKFIRCMLTPIGDDLEVWLQQYPLIRVSVFEPAKQFITFMFHNSDKLILNEDAKTQLENCLSWIHNNIKNMEQRAEEHDADFVSELVKWEMRTMIEMENEDHFKIVFTSMLNRTQEWNRAKRERQKRREGRLREEGWDDAFELRVVGIEVDPNQEMLNGAGQFRTVQSFNVDEL